MFVVIECFKSYFTEMYYKSFTDKSVEEVFQAVEVFNRDTSDAPKDEYAYGGINLDKSAQVTNFKVETERKVGDPRLTADRGAFTDNTKLTIDVLLPCHGCIEGVVNSDNRNNKLKCGQIKGKDDANVCGYCIPRGECGFEKVQRLVNTINPELYAKVVEGKVNAK